jgi:hypothetical protein
MKIILKYDNEFNDDSREGVKNVQVDKQAPDSDSHPKADIREMSPRARARYRERVAQHNKTKEDNKILAF